MNKMSSTKTFTEVYDSWEDFLTDSGTIFDLNITESNLKTLYYLLYARYGNNFITNWDENQFKAKLWGLIWQYGPTWEKRLDIQEKLRNIGDEQLLEGARAIYNHAFNPSTDPSTATLTELTYINDQNTTNYKKSKMDAYTQLWNLLATDVTEDFISKFKTLFKKAIAPFTILYESEEDDDE